MERRLKSLADIEARCAELGFLPFFRCGIPGFSVEEMVAPEYWFTDEEGAWEWKGPVIREGHCAYGKFFAASGCPTLRTTAAPGRWPQMRTQQPSTT